MVRIKQREAFRVSHPSFDGTNFSVWLVIGSMMFILSACALPPEFYRVKITQRQQHDAPDESNDPTPTQAPVHETNSQRRQRIKRAALIEQTEQQLEQHRQRERARRDALKVKHDA